MANQPYPVLAEHSLSAAPRKWLRGGRREPGELPEATPGTVLVFEADGRRTIFRRQHLTGAEPEVVNAVGVTVVSTRETVVTVDLSVPSRSAADEFLISVRFRCRVDRPDVVAEAGLTDLVAPLREHLARDRDLLHGCAQLGVEDIARVRIEVTARISAYCRVRPPWIDGMSVELATVVVYTPRTFQEHETVLRDERWDQQKADLRRAGERANIDYTADVLRDAERATATAVARGDLNSAEVVDRLFREREERRARLHDMIDQLAKSGRLDRVPIDEKYLVDAAIRDAIGDAVPADDRPTVPSSRPKGIGGGSRDSADDDMMIYVDEDELSDD